MEKLEKAVENDEAKIQNNIGVAERMMTCASQELKKSIECGVMTSLKAVKEILQEARKQTENSKCRREKSRSYCSKLG